MAVNAKKGLIKATVFIPTYNGEEYINELLKQVFKQEVPFEYEVLVIDSGSTDNTLEIVKKYDKVRLHEIPNSEFGHGKTRNLAASLATGEFIVFLTQDAVPASKNWLEFILEPFQVSEQVFCVFGKQVPRPMSVAPIKREVFSVFESLGPDHSIMLHRKNSILSNKKTEIYLTFFSDVNSAVRKDYLLKKIPFRDVNYSEDQALGMDVLEAGYIKAYAPLGSVLHSHDYPLKKYFHRKYDEAVGLADTGHFVPRYGFFRGTKEIILTTVKDWRFLQRDQSYTWKHKLYNIIMSPLYNFARVLSMDIAHSKVLRGKLGSHLSLEARSKKKN